MFLYSALIGAVSCPVLIAVRHLILLICKAWTVLFFWSVYLTSSKHFSLNFCTLIWSSVFLNCGVCHPCSSKASALMFGYTRFSRQPHGMLYLDGKIRIFFLFVALPITWVRLRDLKYFYNNRSGDFKGSYSAEIPNQQCPQQCSAPLCKARVVIPASSVRCCGFSTPWQLLVPWLSISQSFSSSFCQHFLLPWRHLVLPDLRLWQSCHPVRAPFAVFVSWQGAVPAPGSWPGGKPSLFCLGDVLGGPVPVIAFPSFWITAQTGLMLGTALFFHFKGLLCEEVKWGLYLTPSLVRLPCLWQNCIMYVL